MAGKVEGKVVAVTDDGNLVTDITEEQIRDAPRDERVAVTQATVFAWLARDCTYVLSRERCVLELGEVLADLGKGDAPIALPETPSTPQVVGSAIESFMLKPCTCVSRPT